VLAAQGAELRGEARELRDIRDHWAEWRTGWEQKLGKTEIQFLRSIAELQAAFQHRVTLMDANYREQVKAQHADFERAMERQSGEIQQRFWNDLALVRTEYERLIHSELRLVRQRTSLAREVEHVSGSAPPEFANVDWLKFAERFRGSEDEIRARQQMYAARFREHGPVLDIGCGRGEMLQVFRDAGITARGIDSNDDSVALCQAKGLEAEKADLFAYLSALPDASLGGVICCQVVEHLPPARLAEMIRLVHAKLRAGGLLAMETPNPECLAIFATHFYIDPTHRHPIPPALASFYLEEAGFGRIEIERLSPAIDSLPSLGELPETFRKEFFGSLDYTAFGIKLG
jgi:2-polyprenyl-3-methyl-5-hydroxy-6-metoxy-1,4-benzoquinol methylase